MKRKCILILTAMFIAWNLMSVTSSKAQSVTFQVFYDNLSPYGAWIDYPGYGYVWIPRAEPGFRPYYSGGHWLYSDHGWFWASDYHWGWAPFHYGTWLYDNGRGWLWVPGYNWAPAWVTWGYYDDYYGWAPLGPRYSITTVSYAPITHWTFVHPLYINSPSWHRHGIIAHRNQIRLSNNVAITKINTVTLVKGTGNYRNHDYYYGPRRQDVERISKQKLKAVNISDNNAPGRTKLSGNSVGVYRPHVSESKNVKPRDVKTNDKNVNAPKTREQQRVVDKPQQDRREPVKNNSHENVNQQKEKREPVNSNPQNNLKPQQKKTPVKESGKQRNEIQQRKQAAPERKPERGGESRREMNQQPQQKGRPNK